MNSTDALREFAEKWGKELWIVGEDGFMHDAPPVMVKELTALISEHHYPKEFLLWLIEQPDITVDITDEQYEYWKENER